MKREDLETLLEAHRKWLETDQKSGRLADLSQANLMNEDLSGRDLRRVNFEGAYLRGCNLKGANLNYARLKEANLNCADFEGASLFLAELPGASLILARLHRADLQGAVLTDANLNRAEFQDAYLFGTVLERAKLNGAQFVGANLNRAKLRGAFLVRANFRNASLIAADLEEADLREAQFSGADLREANFQKARLNLADFEHSTATKDPATAEKDATEVTEARFEHSDLSDARLTSVTGLQSHQLGGADLSNTKLPEDIRAFQGLSHVEELSKHARTVFISLIGGCAFSWLMIATTTDAALLTSSASTPLPIIQTNVPIGWFLLAAPLVLLALYSYLHLYLQNLWESLASLPAIFPDGRKLDERAYPWLLTSLIRAHIPRLRKQPLTFFRTKVLISLITAWGLVPFTIILFWGRYLPIHNWYGIMFLSVVLLVSIYAATNFYHQTRKTLRSDDQVRSAIIDRPVTWTVVTALVILVICYVIDTAEKQDDLCFLGYELYVNLTDVNLSTRPENWTGTGDEAQIVQVKGADLANKDLRFASASGAFLVRANLKDADLRAANLRGADLRAANLRGAVLIGADLQDAYLRNADLRKAVFWQAGLKGNELLAAQERVCRQLSRANQWQGAIRDEALACGQPIPRPEFR